MGFKASDLDAVYGGQCQSALRGPALCQERRILAFQCLSRGVQKSEPVQIDADPQPVRKANPRIFWEKDPTRKQ